MKNKKKLLVPVILLVLVLVLSACSDKSTIKIGFMGTISGPSNDLALNGLNGAELAVQKINEEGGINGRLLELVIKDTLNDKEIVKRVVDEFIESNVSIVIGDFLSSMVDVALSHDEEDRILFLTPTASADKFVGLDDNLIRFIGTTALQAEVMAGQTKVNGDKKFIIIKDATNQAYVNAMSACFIDEIEKWEGEVIYEEGVTYAKIIKSEDIIVDLMEAYPEAEAVYLMMDSTNTLRFLQPLRELYPEISVYTGLWSNTNDLFKFGHKYIEGIYTIGFQNISVTNENTAAFKTEYSSLFNTEPSFTAYFTYDTVMALEEALAGIKQIKPNKVKSSILEIRDFNGLSGAYSINEFGDCSRGYSSMIIKDGVAIDFDID